MSKLLKEIRQEVQVRLDAFKRERSELQKAAERIAVLDLSIAEAQVELESFNVRIPAEAVEAPNE